MPVVQEARGYLISGMSRAAHSSKATFPEVSLSPVEAEIPRFGALAVPKITF
jgi:hypothetical protein